MRAIPSLAILLCLLVVAAGMGGQALAKPKDEPVPSVSMAVPVPQDVLHIISRSASAEVLRLQDIEAHPGTGGWKINTNWISATYFVGAMKLAEIADVPDVLNFSMTTARHFNYAPQGDGAPVHLINADDQAIGDLYQSIYLRTGSPGTLLPLQQRLEYTVPYLTYRGPTDKLVWWWCDSMFMAPPVMARMSAITGDRKYIDAMDVQWWRTYERLYDQHVHLYARDERFIERRSPNGKKIFWARGEGWVLAGLARVLEVMPADYPSRPRYVKLFQEMAAEIAGLQKPDGLWRASLLDEAAFPDPETSGTAFYTYAFAFGINHGLLARDTYLPHALSGWAGLNRYVLPSGLLGQVQSAGDQPVPTRPEQTALYASGGFILAGLEVMKLGQAATALPVGLPRPKKLIYSASDIPEMTLPINPSADQKREHDRREAERQAVKDLAFDPMVDDPKFKSPVPAN